jgi:hypothetical protein
MSNTYLEPEQVDALVDIFQEAKRLLQRRGVTDRRQLDTVAHMILKLAYDGMPPWLILGEIMPPMSPEDAGLPRQGKNITLVPIVKSSAGG